MEKSHPNENIIRQYLLGKLNDQEELEEELSEQMFFDDGLSQMVDAIEDEILDEYLDGALTPADTQAVKEYFLCPQERKDKLQFARVMRRYFETQPSVPTQMPPPLWRETGAVRTVPLRSHFRAYIEIATLILLSISYLLYMAHVRHELLSSSVENQRNLQRLEEERQRAASLEKQVAELSPVSLTLVNPRSRTGRDVSVGHLLIKPSMLVVKIEIALGKDAPPGSFDVALETPAGAPLWSRADVPASGRILKFGMPPQGIDAGSYSIAIRPHGQPGGEAKHYDFHVTVAK